MANSDLQIITLPPTQWETYKHLRLRALQEEPQAFGSSYADTITKPNSYWMDRLTDAEQGNSWSLFAQQNDHIIGMIGGFKRNSAQKDIVNIVALYVVKEARGKGVAKQLLQTLLAEFKKQTQIKKAKLSVNPNQIPALKLYEAFGFNVVGKENTELGDGQLHTELIMEKQIQSS